MMDVVTGEVNEDIVVIGEVYEQVVVTGEGSVEVCLLYTSPSPRD